MRAWLSIRTDAERAAWAKVVIDKRTDRVIDAHLVGHAGEELIHIFALAINMASPQVTSGTSSTGSRRSPPTSNRCYSGTPFRAWRERGRHAMEDALRFGDVLVLRDIEGALQVEDRSGHDKGARAVVDLGTSATPEFRSLVSDAGGPKFSPDRKYLAVSIEDAVRIWSTADWKMLREVKIKTSDSWAVSPGSHYLLGPRYVRSPLRRLAICALSTAPTESRVTASLWREPRRSPP